MPTPLHSVRVENDALRIEVWPGFGGKVSSIVDKADNYELLFNYPTDLPTGPLYDVDYTRGWYAGWDECFPAVAPSQYLGHPYDGIKVPDHGEIWGLPTTVAVPTKDGITTVWNGLRFGYRLSRKLTLDGSSLICDYSLLNLAPFDFRFVWAQHALFSLDQPVTIALDGETFRGGHNHAGEPLNTEFTWPSGNGGETFGQPFDLPKDRGWKLFSREPISRPAVVSYPNRQRTLSIAYQSPDAKAWWGVWLNTGGWGHHNHFAIEPTTGQADQIDRGIRDNHAGTLSANGKSEWQVRISVGNAG